MPWSMLLLVAVLQAAVVPSSVESVSRDVIKAKDVIDYTQKANIVERFAKRFGAGVAQGFAGFSMSERISFR